MPDFCCIIYTLLLNSGCGKFQYTKNYFFSEEGKQFGTITVTAEELSEGRQDSVYFVISATNLDRKDFLGKCDPFLKISRINEDNTWVIFVVSD